MVSCQSVICFSCYILNLLTVVRNSFVKEIIEVSHLQKCDSWGHTIIKIRLVSPATEELKINKGNKSTVGETSTYISPPKMDSSNTLAQQLR